MWNNDFRNFPALIGFTELPLTKVPNNVNAQQISLKFPSSNDQGTPVAMGGGNTHAPSSSCLNTKDGDLFLNALTPNYTNIVTTSSATLTFYYYIPATSANLGEFALTDLNQNPNLGSFTHLIDFSKTTPLCLRFYEWRGFVHLNLRRKKSSLGKGFKLIENLFNLP